MRYPLDPIARRRMAAEEEARVAAVNAVLVLLGLVMIFGVLVATA